MVESYLHAKHKTQKCRREDNGPLKKIDDVERHQHGEFCPLVLVESIADFFAL